MARTTLALLAAAALCLAQDDPKQAPQIVEKPDERGVGKAVGPSTFVDGLLKDAKLAVVAYTATDCPVSKLYRPKTERLSKEYAAKGVRFAVVYCNYADTPASGAHHDKDGALSALLGARRTTEVFVIDASRVLRYRGAIDDQYGIGYDRDAPTRTFLVDALEALLAGQPVKVAATEAPGCAIEREPKARSTAVTFHRDVEPILQRRCQECHRPGEIGPFSLLTYDRARANSKRIREFVEKRLMPPWHADPKHGAWENDRRLTDEEIATIARWVDAGSPEGDAKDAPPARRWPEGWKIGTPDAVFKIPRAFNVPAEGAIPYRYSRVKTSFKEDRWVQAMEVRPGAREVVHHILVFVEYPMKRWKEQPPIDGGLQNGYFAVMAPGEEPLVFPAGMGKLLPAGASLIFQIHYTANGTATKDQSCIGLVFAKEPAKHAVTTRGIIRTDFRIPAGAADHEERTSWRLPHDARLLSLFPHMHVRGKSFRYVARHPDGTEEVLLDVPRYDFRWQTIYRFKEPKILKRGTVIHCTARWDNSAGNPANPDPASDVRFGDQTWEEMMNGYLDFIKAD